MDETGTFTVREPTGRDLAVLKTVLSGWIPSEWQPGTGASAHRWLALVHRIGGAESPAGIAEYQQIVDEGHLLGIAIVPALRGQGLGMTLLQATLDEMRATGCTRCLLEVRRSNVAAQALYERARFTFDGIRRDYYPPQGQGSREDAVLYSREL